MECAAAADAEWDRRASRKFTDLFQQSIMNRLLTRKKAKKAAVVPKFEVNLDLALPSSDNFRTSLLMPNLSARFSMLREQDDPFSKIGKASDDSVLQPRRQSRLHEFGYMSRGLDDIAEVSSISSKTFVPPFATMNGRTPSFASDAGYGTDDDSSSIMGRSRPFGDGNMLFGGRQKVYMMSANGSEASLPGAGGMKGRTIFDHDLTPSNFRAKKSYEVETADLTPKLSLEEKRSPLRQMVDSPFASTSSLQRQTSSSTVTSTPSSTGDSSTSATSMSSQGPTSAPSSVASPAPTSAPSNPVSPSFAPQAERAPTKTRRLYEQGLDRDIKDQQSTSMTRLNSIQRTRVINGRMTPEYGIRTAPFKPHDRFNRPGYAFQTPLSPTPSPPSSSSQETHKPFPPSPAFVPTHELSPSPPMSPFEEEEEERDTVLQSAINPGDRGKATAMGAFNKPQQFNEQKYLERQMTLNSGRNTPTLRMDTPPKPEHPKKGILKNASPEAPMKTRLRAYSTKEEAQATAFSVFQKAANQLKTPLPTQEKSLPEVPEPRSFSPFGEQSENLDSEIQPTLPTKRTPPAIQTAKANRIRNQPIPVVSPSQAPPKHEHPAFRQQQDEPKEEPVGQALTSNNNEFESKALASPVSDAESSTLGISNGGLSGLVRQHLRSASNISDRSQSSIYPATIGPGDYASGNDTLSLRIGDSNMLPAETDTPAHSSYSHSNPWDLEDFDSAYYGEAESSSSMSPTDAIRPKFADASIDDHLNNNGEPRKTVAAPLLPEPQADAPWQQEMKKTHQRGASTETTQERVAFQNELDARRKAIQEKLKDNVEPEPQRSASPTPPKSRPFRGFEMLRTKSSRESFKTGPGAERSNSQRPAGRYPGSSPNPGNMSSSYLPSGEQQSDEWRQPGSRSGSRSNSRAPMNRVLDNQHVDSGYMSTRISEERTRERANSNSQKGRSPPESIRTSNRSRSNSELSGGRSRSRSGRYKDDLEKAMMEGTSSRTTVYATQSPAIPEQFPLPNDGPDYFGGDNREQHAAEPSPRSNNGLGIQSNSSVSSFGPRGLFPPPTPHGFSPSVPASPRHNFMGSMPNSPRPSPGALTPSMARSPLVGPGSPAPSPIPMSLSSSSTPVASQPSTPSLPSFAPAASHSFPLSAISSNVFRKNSGPRKRSIQKSEIGEPKLISTTSVIDTVDLPAGASLRNGMDEVAVPPLPPMNPLRRRFGFIRTEAPEMPSLPFAKQDKASHSADESERSYRRHHRLRKSSSDGAKIGLRLKAQAQAMQSSPALANGVMSSENSQIPEGAMF